MRAASDLRTSKSKPILPAHETLALIFEIRAQLTSQQQQINELARHTTGEINRLWSAICGYGDYATVQVAAGQRRPVAGNRPVAAARQQPENLSASLPSSFATATAPAQEFAGLPPESSAVLSQLYEMEAQNAQLRERVAALEGGNPMPGIAAPAAATKTVRLETPGGSVATVTTPVRQRPPVVVQPPDLSGFDQPANATAAAAIREIARVAEAEAEDAKRAQLEAEEEVRRLTAKREAADRASQEAAARARSDSEAAWRALENAEKLALAEAEARRERERSNELEAQLREAENVCVRRSRRMRRERTRGSGRSAWRWLKRRARGIRRGRGRRRRR